MASFWSRVTQQIKSFDFFAIPVQLTYNGQRAFFTLFGGCVSLILIICLAVVFILGSRLAYIDPTFQKSPAEYNYLAERGVMRPQFGNTLAVSLDDLNSSQDLRSLVRVKFTLKNGENSTYPEAVWCDEMYAKQIE